MRRKPIAKNCLLLGVIVLIHCTYSGASHRSYLRILKRDYRFLPADIIVECLVALVIIIISASAVGGDFVPIRIDVQMSSKSLANLFDGVSFFVFNHRGRVIASALEENFTSPSLQ
ncbi:MMgT domain containing protein [Trichuris trichiura]|uniref:Membrane magnesium transporter n=1 Tax=Trichuris trichiura TaxID=36087 RepID=A0A077Z258_TRITR|nr:MMgT domain containing protein [Trichuris trichiura]